MSKQRRSLDETAAGFAPTEQEQTGILESVLREAIYSDVVVAFRSSAAEDDDQLETKAQAPYRRRKKAVALGFVIAASLAAGSLAVAQTGDSESEIAAQYGLESHTVIQGAEYQVTADGRLSVNGTVIQDPDCDAMHDPGRTTILQQVDDRFYCIVADTPFEAWVIGQKLLGHTPTQAELDERRDELGR